MQALELKRANGQRIRTLHVGDVIRLERRGYIVSQGAGAKVVVTSPAGEVGTFKVGW